MTERPADWPSLEPNADIDLAQHDPPHASAVTEWWYVNAHLTTADDRRLAVFASFFRIAVGRNEETKETEHAHSVTWALVDLDKKAYYHESRVDKQAPRLGLERMDRGEGTKDPRLRRALREILERGNVPYPDHMFERDPFIHTSRLELDFDGLRFKRDDDGRYHLELLHPYFKSGVNLTFEAEKPAVRHGDNGVVQGHDGADMFYYFVPRMKVTGTVSMDGGATVPVTSGTGWYDHEFGGHRDPDQTINDEVAWTWCAVQLDDGRDLSAYIMVDERDDSVMGQRALVIDVDGQRTEHLGLSFEPLDSWVSTRTFNTYNSRWSLKVPDARIELALDGAFADQEFVTLVSKPAFWEGSCKITGTIDGKAVSGRGWVERSGYHTLDNLEDFFKAVGKQVRGSVAALLPYEPSYEEVRDLIASEERDHYMEGVDTAQFVRSGVTPVREITDRGGKGWRSYAALACCDVVGGDSRRYVQWLAMPELMHVGSLIVDDVQDKSTVRRGGPTCHMVHGDALAINAGTACYFMGQQVLTGTEVSDATKLRLYDLYFEALRAGHAGQAADITGLDEYMPNAVETGDNTELESRILSVHRLKTAAPAGALSRMGALIGDGTEEQIEGLGRYFESVGLAFQIVDDVLNLRGFKDDLKRRGEDLAHGKVTMPVAKAMGVLDAEGRQWMWDHVKAKHQDPAIIGEMIERLEACGSVQAAQDQAEEMIEHAWQTVQPLLNDSIVSLMLRSFGWFVLQRHY